MASRSAILIGCGVAGVSAAFRLQRAGMKVKMVERDDRVGGPIRSERVDGCVVDVVAVLMPGSYTAVYRIQDDVGLPDLLAPMTADWATTLMRGDDEVLTGFTTRVAAAVMPHSATHSPEVACQQRALTGAPSDVTESPHSTARRTPCKAACPQWHPST